MTIRALVVDDSATIRALVSYALSQDRDIEVVGAADGPMQAREMIKSLNPDVITLDVEMPGMNGIDFLEKIMTLRPMPVVMLSTLTSRGADATIRALEIGAFDCFAKPSNAMTSPAAFGTELASMVKAAAASRPQARRPAMSSAIPRGTENYTPRADALIAVGSATGGVEALIELFSGFPANCPPTVVVQHMPPTFTATFAARLDRLTQPHVAEARSGAPLLPGHIYIAPGGEQHLEVVGSSKWRCRMVPGDRISGHRPSVDHLFRSVAAAAGRSAVGAILTGMGADGAHGLKAMRDAGAVTIGQDQQSCVVYGMPAVAQEIGAVQQQLPLTRIAQRLLQECRA